MVGGGVAFLAVKTKCANKAIIQNVSLCKIQYIACIDIAELLADANN